MTMITPQRLAHERLPAGHVLALELLQGAGAVVQLLYAGRVVESVQISASRSFGPYMHDMTAAVSCFAGSLVEATVSVDTAPGLSASQRAGSASLVSGAGISGVTYDGSSRVSGYTVNGVAHTVTYPTSTSAVITNTLGAVRNVTFDGSGRVTAII